MIRLIGKIRVSIKLKAAQNEMEEFIDLVENLSKYDINNMRFWSAKIRNTLSLQNDSIEKLYKYPSDELSFAMSINLLNRFLKRNSNKLMPEQLRGTRLLLNSVYALHYPSLKEKGLLLWEKVDEALDYKDHFYQSKINEGYVLTESFISQMMPPEELMPQQTDYTELFSIIENNSV